MVERISFDHALDAANLHAELAREIVDREPERTLALAIPCMTGTVTTEFALSLMSLFAAAVRAGVNLDASYISGGSFIARVRNVLVAKFLAGSEAGHLMFLDDDVGFHGADVIKLLDLDLPIVGGVYKSRHHPDHPCVLPLDNQTVLVREDGLVEVGAMATGFMMIRRDCAQAMVQSSPPCHEYALSDAENEVSAVVFDRVIKNGVLYGEDYGFCFRAREIGWKMLVDPSIALAHGGRKFRFADYLATSKPVGEVPCPGP